jgi:hypothetical protein
METPEDFIKKHLKMSDRDLEYRPVFKYWQTLELMEEYHQAKLKNLGDINDVSNCDHPRSKRRYIGANLLKCVCGHEFS